MTYKEMTRKYEERDLTDYQLRTLEDLKEIHGVDVKELSGYSGLAENHKRLFEKALINFYNTHGVCTRTEFFPKAVNYALEKDYGIDGDRYGIATEIFVLDINGHSTDAGIRIFTCINEDLMLTNTNPDGTWSCAGVDFREVSGNLYGALCKLRDYEVSGFEPDELEGITEKIRIGSVIQRYVIFGIMNNCCIAENKNAPEPYVVWTIDNDRNGVRNGNYFCDFPDAYACFFSLSGMIPSIVEDYWKR